MAMVHLFIVWKKKVMKKLDERNSTMATYAAIPATVLFAVADLLDNDLLLKIFK